MKLFKSFLPLFIIVILIGCGEVRPPFPTEDEIALKALGSTITEDKSELEGDFEFMERDISAEVTAAQDVALEKATLLANAVSENKAAKDEISKARDDFNAAKKNLEALKKDNVKEASIKFKIVVTDGSPKAHIAIDRDGKVINSDPLKVEVLDEEKREIRISNIPWKFNKDGEVIMYAEFVGNVSDQTDAKIEGIIKTSYTNHEHEMRDSGQPIKKNLTLKSKRG